MGSFPGCGSAGLLQKASGQIGESIAAHKEGERSLKVVGCESGVRFVLRLTTIGMPVPLSVVGVPQVKVDSTSYRANLVCDARTVRNIDHYNFSRKPYCSKQLDLSQCSECIQLVKFQMQSRT